MTELSTGVLVIGAGPAGLSAANQCMAAGKEVLVVDDNISAGGQIWRGEAGQAHVRRSTTSHVPFLPSASVISADHATRTVVVETPETSFRIRFGKLIIAAGARELFLPFPGWTLPGVMGVGGLQALVKSGLPVAGKSIVLAGSGPLLLAVGVKLRQAGARVAVIAEQAQFTSLLPFLQQILRSPSKVLQGIALRTRLAGVPYCFDTWVTAAHGDSRLESVSLRQGGRTWTERCDYAGVAYGLIPNVELAALLGCVISQGAVVVNEAGQTSRSDVYCAGESTGIAGVESAAAEGKLAALAACGIASRGNSSGKDKRFAAAIRRSFALRPELRGLCDDKTVVCRCEDINFGELRRFSSFRAAKLQARCGMGPCQARTCGPAVEFLFGWKPDSVRPPLFPARIESLIVDEPVVSS